LLGYTGIRESYDDIKNRKLIIKNHNLNWTFPEALNLKLLSIEFGLFFLTFIFSISLINALRPMPIGWDDLGVYMNFPKIMATTWEILSWGSLYVWQLITWTGFLYQSAWMNSCSYSHHL
jgi:hypothetical protein